jgi:anti-sigma factor RsiW
MTTDRCREWREWLGAYALGQLPDEEGAALEAHLDGCSECRAELASLSGVARLLPLADPEHLDTAPLPPPALGNRIAATIRSEQRQARRRRLRLSFAATGATAAVAAAVLLLFVLPGGSGTGPEQRVSFASVPPGLRIGATLEPHAYGTEIHMYVKGAPSGTLCRVFLRAADGARVPAGSFRYRWGDDSDAVLSAALDLSRTKAVGVHVGSRTFVAPVSQSEAT